MLRLRALVSGVSLTVVMLAPLRARAQNCPQGRNPVTEVGARFQLARQVFTATSNNPFPLVHESPTERVRYLRPRLRALSLGSGAWYVTVRDLQGHPLQTLSRGDFASSADRWTARIPGTVATMDLTLLGAASSPEIVVTEYVAMPDKAVNPYYSVKKRGEEDFHALYSGYPDVNRKFRAWGDSVGFVMGSWGDRVWGCSGVVVGPNLFLTAWHCGGAGADRMLDVAFWNADVCRDMLVDLSWDDDLSSRDYGCVRVIDKDKDRDFALLQIAPITSAGAARPASLSVKPLAPNAALVIIHHPLYMQKQITLRCGLQSWNVAGWVSGTPAVDFSHDCDTEGGSSGAPVFNSAGEVAGLHHHGHAVDPVSCVETDTLNKAVRIDRIIEFLEANRARNGGIVDKLVVSR